MTETSTATTFTPASTRLVLEDLCRVQGWSAEGATLLRLGQNATYQLADRPLVVRVSRSRNLTLLNAEVRVARWLASEGFPSTRLAEQTVSEQPFLVGDRYVTVWQLLPTSASKAGIEDLAHLLRDLHRLPVPAGLNLPQFDPFDRMPERIAAAPTSVPRNDLEFLAALASELQEAYESLKFALPTGPIHSDAHPGNLLKTIDGTAHLVDLEYFSNGPREWDIMLPASYRYSFNWISEEEYRRFVGIYGHDVSNDPCFGPLRSLRELSMTLWLMQNIEHSNAAREEFNLRVSDLRYPGRLRDWKRF